MTWLLNVQVDHGLSRWLSCRASGTVERWVVDVSLPHHHELHQDLPKGTFSPLGFVRGDLKATLSQKSFYCTCQMLTNFQSSLIIRLGSKFVLHTHTTVLLLVWNMSGTTRVSRYQNGKTRKVKTNLDLLEQEIVSGSGICWTICKSAPHPRQPRQHPTTQFLYRLDALPAAQPTASKHWRQALK